MTKLLNFMFFIFLLTSVSCSIKTETITVTEQSQVEYQYVPSEFNNLRIYQVMVESFIDGDSTVNYGDGYGTSHHRGDIRGIIQGLPYIKNLGMNALWLTPIFDSERGTPFYNPDGEPNIKLDATGYYPRNYFKIDPAFGTLEDAREMVDKAHELGLYLFFDGVFGHSKGHVPPSPQGNIVYGSRLHHDFPQSLNYFKEVAIYWIDELEIDGWRFDQAYQIPLPDLKEIRSAVQQKCRQRAAEGKKWGTLGYCVGEVFDLADVISDKAYGSQDNPGLLSAFDFPVRYNLVQVLAVEEKGFGSQPVSVLKKGMLAHSEYPDFAVPNLMLTNHDLVRFGDLIERAGYGGVENPDYWKRYRCALSFLASYTGPITIYYGDEIGAELPGFVEKVSDPEQKCWEKGICDDHVSRTSGQIDNFNENQRELRNYVSTLMKLRSEHPSLYTGRTTNLISEDDIYADLKHFASDSIEDKMVYVLNVSNQRKKLIIPVTIVDNKILKNALSGENVDKQEEGYCLVLEPLSADFYIIE